MSHAGGPEDSPLDRQHKLCGFVRVVVSVSSRSPHSSQPLQEEEEGAASGVVSPRFPAPGVACTLSGDGSAVGFVSDDGFLLTPIQDGDPGPSETSCPLPISLQENAGTPSPRKQRGRSVAASPSTPSSRKRQRKGVARGVPSCSPAAGSFPKRRKGLGFVNGSMNVVHQLHVLTSHKCLRIECRVLEAVVRGDGCARAVVLVDVYLPMAVWSGWQFPRSSALAASLFRHLRWNLSCVESEQLEQLFSLLLNHQPIQGRRDLCTSRWEKNGTFSVSYANMLQPRASGQPEALSKSRYWYGAFHMGYLGEDGAESTLIFASVREGSTSLFIVAEIMG
ncbi:hypothetical protein Taro_004764 [Colocasia esculenta]|uniref:Uncharacterized protein n=1 Tax=Colocasia esculenta TaxID=4460 RepID=A0A843TSG6_COLES|nr:hypothetical protein [Colocasia esculenta]